MGYLTVFLLWGISSRYTTYFVVKALNSSTIFSGSTCTEGDVRLTNGSTPNEGRAEYCYEGDWVPICAVSSATASAICTQLGFNYSRKCNTISYNNSCLSVW